jgi:type IV pilus assembly protein PilM
LRLIELLKLQLYALEVETFPLARSLLNRLTDTAMIIDIGAQATSFHIIDRGTPRVSHSMEYGGKNITQLLMQALSIEEDEAETLKTQHGLSPSLPDRAGPALQGAVLKIAEQAKRVLENYHEQSHHTLNKTIIIGGGALMKGLPEIMTQFLGHSVTVGNPWRGLSYPGKLEQRLHVLGPQYAVAVGLALRGFEEQK